MMKTQRRELIRRLTKHLESVHAASYFSPNVAQALDTTGISHPSAKYLASRSAPMGDVPASVVAATFYNFNPAFVRTHVPECWTKASSQQVHTARLRGVEDMLGAFFGPAAGRSAELPALAQRLAESLQPVLAAQLPDGRALFAGHQEVLAHGVETADPSLQSFMNLWSAATLIREYRGDGHIGALLTHDLSGLEAVVLHCLTGTSFRPRAARRSRGWSDAEWDEALSSLRDRGLARGAGDDAQITDRAAELREQIERATDDSTAVSWQMLSDEQLQDVAAQARDFSRIIVESGVFPAKVFNPGSGRTAQA